MTVTVSSPLLVRPSMKPVTLIAVGLPGAVGLDVVPAIRPPTCVIEIVFAT